MAHKTNTEKNLDELNQIIEDLGLKGIIKAEPIQNQINLYIIGEDYEKMGRVMPVPIAGYSFSDCFAFLKGYHFAKTGKRYEL
jgi:hypothetical protein